jgi:hypothetical protein
MHMWEQEHRCVSISPKKNEICFLLVPIPRCAHPYQRQMSKSIQPSTHCPGHMRAQIFVFFYPSTNFKIPTIHISHNHLYHLYFSIPLTYIIYISQFHSRISSTFLNSTQVYHLHFSIPLIYIMYISQFQYIYITHNHLYHLNFSIPRKICTHTYAWTGTHTNLGFLEHPNGGRNGLAIIVCALAPAAQDKKQNYRNSNSEKSVSV